MSFSIRQRISVGFGVALIILLIIGLASYRSISELVKSSDDVSRGRDLIAALAVVSSDMKDAETGQRGYIITGDDRYLEPYRKARNSINGDVAGLENLLADSSNQQQLIHTLEAAISAKLVELNRTMELRQNLGFNAAAAEVDTHLGRNLMDQIRNLVAAMGVEEQAALKQKQDAVRADAKRSVLIILIGLVFAFTVIPFSNVIIQQEVARRERLEEALLRAKNDAERANRFKDEFLSTMSHELRTPLNAVLGFSDLLKEERYGPLNPRQRRYVDHIHTGGDHLLRLINDILDLSRIEAGRMDIVLEDTNVAAIFNEVAGSLRPLAEARHQELEALAEPDLAVRVDATRFKQVLTNLVANAIKFTPDGGHITLAAEKARDRLTISVRDTGPGISASEHKTIFEGFYRSRDTARSIEGSGLGLTITQRLVALHNSKLELQSEPGSGSRFYFTLPLIPPFRQEVQPGALADPQAAHLGKILVVEDDAVSADLIQSHLTSSGYEVVVCKNSQFAVAMAAELQPRAITLDILMTPVTGWDLLVKLRNDARTAEIPIIVVTIVDQRSLGTTLGADEYLVKPVERASLLAAVERCMGSRRRSAPNNDVLVVEDDPQTREVLSEMLTEQGYQVSTAEDGAQARDKIARALPALVILDLILPKMSGFQLLSEWRSALRTAEMPVFVLTNKDLSSEEESYLRAHAQSLVKKQVYWKDTLLVQIRRVMEQGRPHEPLDLAGLSSPPEQASPSEQASAAERA